MWNWSKNNNSYWKKPADEMFYLISRWNKEGKKGSSILDVGSGIGRNSIFFAKNGFNVTALDNSESGLEILQKQSHALKLNINTIKADMHAIPLKSNSYDYIVAYHSIYHTDWTGLLVVVSELFRVLKPDGEMFLTLLSSEDDEYMKRYEEVTNKTLLKREEEGSLLKHLYISDNDIKKIFKEENIISIKLVKEYYDHKTPCHFHILLNKKNNATKDI